MQSRKIIALLVSLAFLAVGAVTASAASASSPWEFNGTELTGTETVLGIAHPSTLSIPGLTMTCGHMLIFMKIDNSAGAGKGEVTKLLSYECSVAGGTCKVETVEPEKLPWPLHVTTTLGKNYVVIEGIRIELVLTGELCPFEGSPIIIKGTAGGLFNNATSTLTFDAATFTATGTSLKVGSSSIEWAAAFPLEALGKHSGEALEIS
jgi:hypothetical protein